jgi:hypothetical protein
MLCPYNYYYHFPDLQIKNKKRSWHDNFMRIQLDDYEQDILESGERGEWNSVQNLQQAIEQYQHHARNYILKTVLKFDRYASVVICIVIAAQ